MKSYIPTLLEEIFGDVRKHSEHKGQISFDCPECDNGKHKGNLEVNYESHVFKCWSCKDYNQMSGTLYTLIKNYGTEMNLDMYQLLKKDNSYISLSNKTKVDERELEIPSHFVPIHGDKEEPSVRIHNYLYERGLNDYLIKKFQIHYSTTKGFKGRFYVPSYDTDGKMTYFVGRSIYDFLSPKYKNPDLDKDKIIMFEHLINWEADIYIVEGVMDAIVIPNAIPILGKYISYKLMKALRSKAKGKIIVCLDGDALEDGKKLYNDLNILELQGRVRIVEFPLDLDASKIYQDYGYKTLLKFLKSAHILPEI